MNWLPIGLTPMDLGEVVATNNGVDHEVVPGACPVLSTPEYSFSVESSLCKSTLLARVVNIRLCLNPIDWGYGHEVVCKQSLRLTAIAVTSGFRNQVNPYIPGSRLGIWAVSDNVPRNGADRLAGRYQLHHQSAALVAAQSILLDGLPNVPPPGAEVVEFAGELAGLPQFQQFRILDSCPPQPHSATVGRGDVRFHPTDFASAAFLEARNGRLRQAVLGDPDPERGQTPLTGSWVSDGG